MTPTIVIPAALVVTGFTAWLTYCCRESPLALWLMPAASGTLGVCWMLLARWLDDTKGIIVASVAWDVSCVAVFALFPVLLLGHRASLSFWAGLFLSVAGIALMQRS